jgi:predicted TIM-barrel fold metal-dependent hydrolase
MTSSAANTVELASASDKIAPEDIVDPDLEIIDCHHHLWDGSHFGGSPYFLDELARDLADGHNIVATVYLEAGSHYISGGPEHLRPVGETVYANAMAEEAIARGIPARVCEGIVAHANLDLGEAVDEILDAHLDAAPSRLRGIRDMVHPDVLNGVYEDKLQRLMRPSYRAGMKRLARKGLSMEAMLFDFQLDQLIDAARAVPDLPIVLNHLGGIFAAGPHEGRRDEKFAQWKDHITKLSRLDNVLVKLGGMGIPVSGYNWDRLNPPSSDQLAQATGRYFHHAIEQFGPDRCMSESNFPVDAISGPYRTLWNSFKKIAARYSEAERSALFAGTARRHYRLS